MKKKLIEHKGFSFWTRPDTLDEYVVKEVFNSYKHLDLNENDIVLDAGANIGAFAVLAASVCKKVICFEPDPENCKLITRNLRKNKLLHKVEIHQAALTDKTGEMKLYLNGKKNRGNHQMFERRGRKSITVKTTAWKELGKEYNKLKVDIEGSEYYLIENCIGAIMHVEKAVIEMHINGFTVERYNNAVNILETNFPKGVYDKEPKKKWHTYAKINK